MQSLRVSPPTPPAPAAKIRLTPRARVRLGLEIVRAYAVIRWWLQRSDVEGTVAAARRASRPCAELDEATMPAAIRLGWAVQKTLRVLPLDTKCLIRSLVLLRLLATRGYESALVIGVCAHPTFGAHAWIEANGIALLPTEPRFHRLTEM